MTDPTPKRLRQIERAIRKLPPLQREIFCAARFEDMTDEQIAERYGLTIPEAEALLQQALMNFMLQLDWKPKRWWQRR